MRLWSNSFHDLQMFFYYFKLKLILSEVLILILIKLDLVNQRRTLFHMPDLFQRNTFKIISTVIS